MSVGVDTKTSNGDFVVPNGGWGWVIVLSSFLIHFIMDGITYALGQYLDVFIVDFESTYAVTSIIHSLLPAVTLGCGPIGSTLTNLLGCRLTTIIGGIIAAIGFVIGAYSTNIYLLIFSIGGVAGLGFGLVYVPAIVSVGYYFEEMRPLAMGIAVCGSGVGTFLLAPLNRYLLENFAWRGAFIIKAGIILNICVCAMVMKPLPIEPAEILKRKKKLEKEIKKLRKTEDSGEKEIGVSLTTKQATSEQPVAKLTGSTPCISNDDKTKTDNFLQIPDNNNNQFFKSLPTLAEDEKAKTHEEELLKSYSSLNMLAHMRSNRNIADDNLEISYTKANTSEPTKDVEAASKRDEPKNKNFDLTLFCNFIFMFFCVSNFLTSLGFNAPFIFITDQAKSYGISAHNADWLLQTIGISNTVGRIILGIISKSEKVNRLYIYATVITICGIACIVESFLKQFVPLLIYSAVFGFTSGGYVSLTALLLVDLLGLENLSNAFGILLVFQGVATAIGPPIGGGMRDAFASFTAAFLFFGVAIAISGAMCFLLPLFSCYRRRPAVKK